jgi:hypothetical protein
MNRRAFFAAIAAAVAAPAAAAAAAPSIDCTCASDPLGRCVLHNLVRGTGFFRVGPNFYREQFIRVHGALFHRDVFALRSPAVDLDVARFGQRYPLFSAADINAAWESSMAFRRQIYLDYDPLFSGRKIGDTITVKRPARFR